MQRVGGGKLYWDEKREMTAAAPKPGGFEAIDAVFEIIFAYLFFQIICFS